MAKTAEDFCELYSLFYERFRDDYIRTLSSAEQPSELAARLAFLEFLYERAALLRPDYDWRGVRPLLSDMVAILGADAETLHMDAVDFLFAVEYGTWEPRRYLDSLRDLRFFDVDLRLQEFLLSNLKYELRVTTALAQARGLENPFYGV